MVSEPIDSNKSVMPRSNEYRTPTSDVDALWSAIRTLQSQADDRATMHALSVGSGGLTVNGGAIVVRDPSGNDQIRIGPLAGGGFGVQVFDSASGRWIVLS